MVMQRMVIKSSEWLRGTGAGVLRNSMGLMCCMGIYARKILEIRPIVLENLTSLSRIQGIECPFVGESKLGVQLDTDDACNAMAINDDEELSDKEMVEKLRPIFKRHGISIIWSPDL